MGRFEQSIHKLIESLSIHRETHTTDHQVKHTMPSDYASILTENLETYGRGINHLTVYENLYSDRNHFIYELLQNAEDARARQIQFRLNPDQLEVVHDGTPFDEKDVRGVCGINEGTKRNDLTKIGKFGLGFKAVYAYADTVDVHSGDEHFRIEGYIRPSPIPPVPIESGYTTLFRLPFSPAKCQSAFELLSRALEGLKPETLLYLRFIQSIEIVINETKTLTINRKVRQLDPLVRKVSLTNSHSNSPRRYLIFSKSVENEHVRQISRELRIEIAFRLNNGRKSVSGTIARVDESPLFVYFPTREMTNLGFLIQGPYRTTPTREAIPLEESFNQNLILQTSDLLVAALHWFRDHKRLDKSVLLSLPIRSADFPEDGIFRPLFDRVVEAFRTDSLIPVSNAQNMNSDFVRADSARLNDDEDLEALLPTTILRQFYHSSACSRWVSRSISEEKELFLYFSNDVGLETFDEDDLINGLNAEFLKRQSSSWMRRFYAYILGNKALMDRYRRYPHDTSFVRHPIVRLSTGEHIKPFTSEHKPAAYLPAQGYTSVRTVDRDVVSSDGAKKLFDVLGFETADELAEIEHRVLPRYRSSPKIEIGDYERDIDQIVRVYSSVSASKKQRLQELLVQTPFIRARNAESKAYEFVRPNQAYRLTNDTELFFGGNPKAWLVTEPPFLPADFLLAIGVASKVRLKITEPDRDGHIIVSRGHSNHRRGRDGFDPDFSIDGLAYAVGNPSRERSAYIWNRLLNGRSIHIRGVEERASKKTFERAKSSDKWSTAGEILRDAAWLPSRTGQFHRPKDISLSDLPEEFVCDLKLANQLGMRCSTKVNPYELAKHVGIDPAVLDLLQTYNVSAEELREYFNRKKTALQGSSTSDAPTKVELQKDRSESSPTDQRSNRVPLKAGSIPERRQISDYGDNNEEYSARGPTNSSVSVARPRPEEGLRAQEWLRRKLNEVLGSSVHISASEEVADGEAGRSDIIIRSSHASTEVHIEVKRIQARRIYWSERQIDVAKNRLGYYYLALLTPLFEAPDEAYTVHWVWDPLTELVDMRRIVQWTWRVEATCELDTEWRPSGPAPSREANGFKAMVDIGEDLLASLPSGFEAIKLQASKMGLFSTK